MKKKFDSAQMAAMEMRKEEKMKQKLRQVWFFFIVFSEHCVQVNMQKVMLIITTMQMKIIIKIVAPLKFTSIGFSFLLSAKASKNGRTLTSLKYSKNFKNSLFSIACVYSFGSSEIKSMLFPVLSSEIC